jgi:hypothetical protein
VVAAEITTEGADFEQLEPMIGAAERELDDAGVTERPEVVLADAGYWSNGHIDALRERGMTPIVAPDTTRNRPRKTRRGGPYDFMRRVIATEKGGDLYSRRQCMVEPVFAQIKSNRRPTQLAGGNSLIGGLRTLLLLPAPFFSRARSSRLFVQQPSRGSSSVTP